MKKVLFLAFLFFTVNNLIAQDSTEVKLIGKTWIGESYDIPGVGVVPVTEEEQGFFKFNADKTCELGQEGDSEKGIWKYDPQNKKVIFRLPSYPFDQFFIILSITDNKLVFEQIQDGTKMKVTLKAKE